MISLNQVNQKTTQELQAHISCNIIYKLIDIIILKRIEPLVENVIPTFQASFWPNRACYDQVLVITSYMDKGYNNYVNREQVSVYKCCVRHCMETWFIT